MEDPKYPGVMSQEDRDSIEIRFLRLQNLELQSKMLVRDLEACRQMMLKEKSDLELLKVKVSEKYGIDLEKDKINADGTIERGALNKAG